MSVEVALLVAVLLLLGNAFFVGAEFGLVSVRRSAMELQAVQGSRAAKITLDAMEQVSLMLAAAQLGITLCSLGLGAVAEPLIAHWLEVPFHAAGVPDPLLHPISFIVALAVTVYLHVVIGEMVPKNIALASPERTALLLTPPLAMVVRVLRPIILLLNAIANGVLRAIKVQPAGEVASTFTRDEVAGFVEESHREGLLSEDREQLLSGALRFDTRKVRSVLLPLDQLVLATTTTTPLEVEQLASKTGFSRFPVRNSRKKLVGYIHVKDALAIDQARRNSPLPRESLRPLATVRISDSLRSALTIMQRSGTHLAQVVGPRQRVLGVVALEDMLEELVGEITDASQKRAKHTE
jgi:CBS domain containing-hemolysin-like protein